MQKDQEQLEKLRSGIDVLIRVLKITDSTLLPDGRTNLNVSDAHTLAFIAAHEGCIASEIGKHLDVSATTVSSIINRLVDHELVRRGRTDNNRRVVFLYTTESGAQAASEIIAEQRRHCQQILEALPQAEQVNFIKNVSTIANTFQKG